MKKLISMILCGALAMSIASCSASGTGRTSGRTDSGSANKSDADLSEVTVTETENSGGSGEGSEAEAAANETDAAAGPAEDFDPELFFETTDRDGNVWNESSLSSNKLTMINFWEPWCGPCVREIPDLERLYENYKDNRLDTKNNSVQLGQNFTMERVAYVLANTIQIKSHDGRISDANKAWAASVQVAEDKSEWGDNRNLGFLVDRVNPGLLDLLANQVRAMMVGEKGKDEKRISIQEILHKSTSKQPLEKKHHERSHEDVL